MAGKIRISKAKTDRQGIPDKEKSMVKARGKRRGSRSTTMGVSKKGEDGAEGSASLTPAHVTCRSHERGRVLCFQIKLLTNSQGSSFYFYFADKNVRPTEIYLQHYI